MFELVVAPDQFTPQTGQDTWLGEGPLWSVDEQCVWWIDIEGACLHRWSSADGAQAWPLAARPGAVWTLEGGQLLVPTQAGIGRFDPAKGVWTKLGAFEPGNAVIRPNDGTADRQGRFWCGTMHEDGNVPRGSLYRLNPDLSVTRFLEDITIPNSLCWSPDGRRMFFTDSSTRTIRVFDYDPTLGEPSNGRVFATTEAGEPDGATVDAEGCLWSCEWGAGRIVRYAPDGGVDRIVETPVSKPTCCVFGGPDLDVLFVSTARMGLDDAQRQHEPWAGGLLAFQPGPRGVPDVHARLDIYEPDSGSSAQRTKPS